MDNMIRDQNDAAGLFSDNDLKSSQVLQPSSSQPVIQDYFSQSNA